MTFNGPHSASQGRTMPTESPATSFDAAATSAKTTSANFLLRPLVDLDIALSLWIHEACLPTPRWLLKVLEISGDGRFWFPIPISLYCFSSRSSILLGLILGSLLDVLLVGLIKHLVRRPRPVYNKGMRLTFAVDHWSFPSGHSSRVFFIASFLSNCADPFRVALDSHRWVHGYFGGILCLM
ncbi:probable lipid phosphate phosphatase beta isoform X2 [Phalaenopsis equestris]|uniref:probable lipid phosphate phosphatase beta isoform X2 n=1 Tax=Phalaenopsis equestris TaxID=78828 RepID=UPI0009E5E18C|nr:probable lipid phosphate phosphatase beta isoform X2 [Phalaenopsis equestris]